MRSILEQVWTNNANKQMSLSNVIKTTCDALKKDKLGAGAIYADLIGDGSKNKEKRTKFVKTIIRHLNWVIYNGESEPTAIELVKVSKTDLDKYTKQIKQYQLTNDEQPTTIEGCSNHIEVESEVAKTKEFTIKFDSGYEETIVREVKDKKGNVVTEKATLYYVPRAKAQWGYTKEVKEAFFAALDELDK